MELVNVLRGAESMLRMPLSYEDIQISITVLERLRESLKSLEREQRLKSFVVYGTAEVRVRLECEARNEKDAREELRSYFQREAFHTSDHNLEIMEEELLWHSICAEADELDEEETPE